MKLFLTVQPNAKVTRAELIDRNHLKVFVKASPKEGKANQAVLEVLSDYLKIPKSFLILRSGFASRNKVVEVKSA